MAIFAIQATAIERDEDGYYLIATTADFEEFANLVNTGSPYESARVTANNILVTRSIGTGEFQYHYRGHFDGQGYTLLINDIPLFEHTEVGCIITNVNLVGNLRSTTNNTGPLIAEAVGATIEQCNSEVVVDAAGRMNVGGFVGKSRGTIILKNCSFTGVMMGNNNCAGLVGWNEHSAIIKSCSVHGAKTLVGNLQDNNVVENCYVNNIAQARMEVTIEVNDSTDMKQETISVDSISVALEVRSEVPTETKTIDGISYVLTNGGTPTAHVQAVSQKFKSVRIPSCVEYNGIKYIVVTIAEGALSNRTEMEYIEIPGTVNELYNNTFQKCTGLKEIVFNDSENSLKLGYNVHALSILICGIVLIISIERSYAGLNVPKCFLWVCKWETS